MGFYQSEIEAARAYDASVLAIRPPGSFTNFDYSNGAEPPPMPSKVLEVVEAERRANIMQSVARIDINPK